MRTSDDPLEPIVQLPNRSRNEHVSTLQHLKHEEEATRTQYPVTVAHLVSETDEEQISPPSSKKKAKKKKKKHISPEDEYQRKSDDEQVTPPSSRKKKKHVPSKEESSTESDEKQAPPSSSKSSKRKKKKKHVPPEEEYSTEGEEEQASPSSSKKKKKKHIPSEDDYDEPLSPASSKKKKNKKNKTVSASEMTPEGLLASGGTTNQFITYNNSPGYTQLQPPEQPVTSEPKNSYPSPAVIVQHPEQAPAPIILSSKERTNNCCIYGPILLLPLLFGAVGTILVGMGTSTCKFFTFSLLDRTSENYDEGQGIYLGPWMVDYGLGGGDEYDYDDTYDWDGYWSACEAWETSLAFTPDETFDGIWLYGRAATMAVFALGGIMVIAVLSSSCCRCCQGFCWAPFLSFAVLSGLSASTMAMMTSSLCLIEGNVLDDTGLWEWEEGRPKAGCSLDIGAYLVIGAAAAFLVASLTSIFLQESSSSLNDSGQLQVIPPAAHLATANQYMQQPQLLLDTEERGACGCSVAFVTISIVVSAILATVCLVLALVVIWHPGWVVVCFIASVVLFIVTCGCLCGLCCVNRD